MLFEGSGEWIEGVQGRFFHSFNFFFEDGGCLGACAARIFLRLKNEE